MPISTVGTSEVYGSDGKQCMFRKRCSETSEEHQLPMNPSIWSGFMYIYICSFYLSCLAHHVSSFTYGLYLWGIVWINPPLVNQPVAKRHPSIPLIHGWIMKWSKLVFLSWLPSGKHTKKLWKITMSDGKTHYKWPFSIANC